MLQRLHRFQYRHVQLFGNTLTLASVAAGMPMKQPAREVRDMRTFGDPPTEFVAPPSCQRWWMPGRTNEIGVFPVNESIQVLESCGPM
jgi:hypothetical protein